MRIKDIKRIYKRYCGCIFIELFTDKIIDDCRCNDHKDKKVFLSGKFFSIYYMKINDGYKNIEVNELPFEFLVKLLVEDEEKLLL